MISTTTAGPPNNRLRLRIPTKRIRSMTLTWPGIGDSAMIMMLRLTDPLPV